MVVELPVSRRDCLHGAEGYFKTTVADITTDEASLGRLLKPCVPRGTGPPVRRMWVLPTSDISGVGYCRRWTLPPVCMPAVYRLVV